MKIKPIPGWPQYGASRDGRIWSYRRGKFLKPKISQVGYLVVTLAVDGRNTCKTVHRLVAEAWIPNPRGYRCINHLDSDRTNSAVENLEWCTHAQNSAHAVARGRMRRGANHPDATLTERQVREIRATKDNQRITGLKYGVSATTICDIRRRKSWRHI